MVEPYEEEVELEEAPKGMFPEDDEDSYEIELDEDLDVWNRGSGYTWGGGTAWWQSSHVGSSVSSMWSMGGSAYHADNHASRMLKHKNHIDSLCKVVDPTVPHTLEFATDHSSGHTDMRRAHIVVDGSLIRHSDTKLDILAGLAIHEKLHVIHSKPLMDWQYNNRRDLCKSTAEVELFQSISNIVEDEYIERQLHKTCAGYVHYIEACKQHYFGEAKNSIDASPNDFVDLINTFLMLVRYPSEIDMDRRKRHAPHIRVLMSMIKNGIDTRESTYKCISNVHKYMLAQAEKMSDSGETLEDAMPELKDRARKMAEDRIHGAFPNPEDDDIDADLLEEMITNIAKDRLKDLIRIWKDENEGMSPVESLYGSKFDRESVDTALHEELDTISKQIAKKISDLADSDYYETDIGALALTNGQKDITWQKAKQTSMSTEKYSNGKRHMRKQISKLKKKVQLYGNLQKYNIYNQKRGMINKRQLHKIPMGMTDLFKSTIVKEDKPLDVCLLVDESGSMGHFTMRQARHGAIAIKEALQDNDMINLWVYGHSADENVRGQTDMVEYSSPTMGDRPMAMGGMRARYENRDGNAIVASVQRIKQESDNNAHKLMIVLSDGSPSADKYRGATAYEHTRKCVKYAETQGWSIIQVGFSGATEWIMDKTFDNWVYVDDTEKLGDEVSKIIRKVIKI